jgi:hypothetical protein
MHCLCNYFGTSENPMFVPDDGYLRIIHNRPGSC